MATTVCLNDYKVGIERDNLSMHIFAHMQDKYNNDLVALKMVVHVYDIPFMYTDCANL